MIYDGFAWPGGVGTEVGAAVLHFRREWDVTFVSENPLCITWEHTQPGFVSGPIPLWCHHSKPEVLEHLTRWSCFLQWRRSPLFCAWSFFFSFFFSYFFLTSSAPKPLLLFLRWSTNQTRNVTFLCLSKQATKRLLHQSHKNEIKVSGWTISLVSHR